MYPLEADTKMISMRQQYAVEHTTFTSKEFHVFKGCYINEIFILALFFHVKYMNSQYFQNLLFLVSIE